MTKEERALAYLRRDPVLYVNLLEAIRRDSGILLDVGRDGLLLFEQVSGAYMMSAATEGAYRRLIQQVPRECDLFVGHEMWYLDRAAQWLGLKEGLVCFCAAWPSRTPAELPPFQGELRLLGPEYAPLVTAHYQESDGDVARMERAIARGMPGIFVEGELAGFVGFHDEGSIGMLEVLPAYRRRGLGEVLEKTAINLALERGKYAFGQVVEGNTVSLALQRKVGMVLSETRQFWLF